MFKDSVILITGGAAGIGRATGELLAQQGGRINILDLTVDKVPADWTAYQGSVTDDAAISSAVDDIVAREGRIDILVNNAGISFYGSIEDGTMDDWSRVIDVNLISVARVSRLVLPHLRKSRHPAIVNIASCLAQTGLARRALYSATKGGVEALTRAMAADLVSEGIRVNCVNPGTVDTDFVRGLATQTGRDVSEFAARQATGHMVSPDEVAHAVAYLARPGARSTIGSVLTVEAGFGQLHS
ncbi:SDR family oxidoreductase [Rhodopseudomonas sp. HC1]|uniref:SDR family NAD(P)-dependent oxidoreductase n=1 Tax=Rhodopseudomonas infernalis TaxID=2897386 RepID=UPI001EE855F6|nr:SDR family oxidoreductase [Rhodopseudomonas infernalis]MCG6204973.1 SDR family oxidoreductase [Rhodopseudomonas infernalis]